MVRLQEWNTSRKLISLVAKQETQRETTNDVERAENCFRVALEPRRDLRIDREEWRYIRAVIPYGGGQNLFK